MRGRIRRSAFIGALLFVGLSVVVSPLADLRGSAEAMACCAKTDYRCAGMSSPDDCCQRMGQAAHGVPAGTMSDARLHQPSVTTVSPSLGDRAASASRSVAFIAAFKRPHDPPHLHAFSLLI